MQQLKRYQGPVNAVVLDWAGTTVDHGCMAPAATFMEAFARAGVPITIGEARADMGKPKRAHVKAILDMRRVSAAWLEVRGKSPGEREVEEIYRSLLQLQVEVAERYSEVIPGVVETVLALRARGLAVASTTGYPRAVMEVLVPAAKRQGYEPDVVICADDTPEGRPGPFMALEALVRLSISPVESVVKVGDTAVDIAEGLNGGMWSVGVAVTGNEVGLSASEYAALAPREQEAARSVAAGKLKAAGAHYVVSRLDEVMAVLDDIEKRLAAGEKP
ncbi:MAG: phosphonoacetaldehyde hydrolase [Acidimicrobiales bacterium]